MRILGRESLIGAVMMVAIWKPRKEQKAASHYHARVNYFERVKVKVTFTIGMSFLHTK